MVVGLVHDPMSYADWSNIPSGSSYWAAALLVGADGGESHSSGNIRMAWQSTSLSHENSNSDLNNDIVLEDKTPRTEVT